LTESVFANIKRRAFQMLKLLLKWLNIFIHPYV